MMKVIKGESVDFVCPKCKHIEVKSRKTLILEVVRSFFLISMGCMGALFILLVIALGPSFIYSTMLEVKAVSDARAYNDEIRAIVLNHTTYSGEDNFEWALDIASHLGQIRYVPVSKYVYLQDAMYTYEHGGDCKSDAILLRALLEVTGIPNKIDCDIINEKHCTNKIYHNSKDQYMIIDLTGGIYRIFKDSTNHWEDPWITVDWGYL